MERSRRQLNWEATRAALIKAARQQFADSGYKDADLSRIAAGAAVTTGAIYHHFESKLGLFRAVAESLELEILQATASGETDPLAALRAGFIRLIDVCAAPDIQRIIFVEAPQVIGVEAWQEVELRYAYGAMSQTVAGLSAAAAIPDYPPELLARLLLALLRETSRVVAHAGHDASKTEAARQFATSVLDALFAAKP